MIYKKDITFKAMRSRGPGGQNVNKVNSAALLLWNFEESTLSDEKKVLLRTKLCDLINKSGEVYIRSDEFRDLERNKKRCLEKLKILITKAFFKPKPRKKTRPTKSSINKRLDSKKINGEKKLYRKKVY